MAVQKTKARGGRIVATVVPVAAPPTQFLFNNTQNHGHMAPSFGQKTLRCFYCNKKSGIKYDGLIRQWQCGHCEADNFLDENGDITDPPVATNYAAPPDLKYAAPQPEPPYSPQSPQSSASTVFCSTCIKNQHLYTACLAQYHIELDPTHPEYKQLERKYYKYKRNLEKQYPQVCEDCEPKVLERMREAGKTAKTDYLRRLLEKSRARRAASRTPQITISGVFEFTGKYLWYFGLATQLLWHITALITAAQYSYPVINDKYIPSAILEILSWLSERSSSLSSWSLRCSLASAWWNPKFKYLNNGFINHINGFGEWYKHQMILLVVRCLIYYIIGTGVLADPFAPATIGAHAFGFVFITYLSIAANCTLKVDMTPLWNSTPVRLPNVGPSTSPSPKGTGNSMADALDQILATPSQGIRPMTPPSFPSYEYQQQDGANSRHGGRAPSTRSSDIRNMTPVRQRIFNSSMGVNNLSSENSPTRSNQNHGDEDQDMMDWSPAQNQSGYRAFNSTQSIQHDAELFNQSPIASQPAPFWYKVPPAPTTPAQRLRNPPNQPRFRVSSQEVKENFFNNVTRRAQASGSPVEPQPILGGGRSTHEIEFAQQKFFPPSPPSEAGENLAELLTSFSLSSETETSKNTAKGHRVRHSCQALILLLGLVFWNQALHHPTGQTRNVTLAVMCACACLGVRTILDNMKAIAEKQHNLVQTVGTILGGIELVAAIYGIQEILVGHGDCANYASLGTILIGGMMVYEIWRASFG